MAHASVGKGKQNHTKPRYSLGNSRALCNGISPINPTRPSQLVLYGLPALVIGYMFILLQVYVLKYATDVLLIAPAVVGAIFGLARIWDAVTDPVIGYLSDRTQSRMGRRRIWLAGSIFPAAGFYIMLYASPVGLSPGYAAVWMGVAVFGFYTAMTAITVPHYSLGAEVTKDSYMRNKLFGMRHAMIGAGAILALLTLRWLTSFDPADTHSLRAASLTSASVAAAIGVVGVLATAVFFREPAYSAATNIPASGIYAASKSVLKNPRARLLLIVQFIESIGSGALTAAALYVAQYVLGNIGIAPLAIVCYLATATVSIPLWVRVSKSVPKVELWIITMAGICS